VGLVIWPDIRPFEYLFPFVVGAQTGYLNFQSWNNFATVTAITRLPEDNEYLRGVKCHRQGNE